MSAEPVAVSRAQVTARHLTHFGYSVSVIYPKPTQKDLYKARSPARTSPAAPNRCAASAAQNLVTQVKSLGVPVLAATPAQGIERGKSSAPAS
jgi:hypothetical protein